MPRTVLCPKCKHSNLVSQGSYLCWFCSEQVEVALNDFQDLIFKEITDGYHSWYSHPTAYHTIYICKNYPNFCKACYNNKDTFCQNGKIDIREPVK